MNNIKDKLQAASKKTGRYFSLLFKALTGRLDKHISALLEVLDDNFEVVQILLKENKELQDKLDSLTKGSKKTKAKNNPRPKKSK